MLRFVVAAGWLKSPEDAVKYRGVADELVLGSFTPQLRLGNTGANFHHDADYSTVLNSIGLKNQGLAAAIKEFGSSFDLSDKTVMMRVSVAGFGVQDYVGLVRQLIAARINRWEFNIGCPNGIGHDGMPERMLSFDLQGIDSLLSEVTTMLRAEKRRPYIAIKPSPYSDMYQLKDTAQVINSCPFISEVVASNTFADARAYSADGKPLIEVAGGYAGYSGKGVKAIALGQVARFRQHLRADIAVAGAGGVHSGVDAHDFELAGASKVHIGSKAFLEGPRAVSRIMQEYAEVAK